MSYYQLPCVRTGDPLSDHLHIASLLRTRRIQDVSSLNGFRDGAEIRLLCMIQEIKLHTTKKNEKMCFLTLSDGSGELEAVVFPDLFAVSAPRIKVENIVLLTGKISVKDDSVTVVCGSVLCEQEFPKYISNMKLCVKLPSDSPVISRVREICGRRKGDTAVCFYFTDIRKTLAPKERLSVEISPDSYRELSEAAGRENIGLIR